MEIEYTWDYNPVGIKLITERTKRTRNGEQTKQNKNLNLACQFESSDVKGQKPKESLEIFKDEVRGLYYHKSKYKAKDTVKSIVCGCTVISCFC